MRIGSGRHGLSSTTPIWVVSGAQPRGPAERRQAPYIMGRTKARLMTEPAMPLVDMPRRRWLLWMAPKVTAQEPSQRRMAMRESSASRIPAPSRGRLRESAGGGGAELRGMGWGGGGGGSPCQAWARRVAVVEAGRGEG